MRINYSTGTFCTGIGIIGAFIAQLYGGWTQGMTTLIIFMTVDYITGLLVAGIWHNSRKTEDGRLESRAGWKGLVRKGVTLLIVLIASRLDMQFHTTLIRDAAVIGFMANEGISILENAGLMGVKFPKVIVNALEVLQNQADSAKVPGFKEEISTEPMDDPEEELGPEIIITDIDDSEHD